MIAKAIASLILLLTAQVTSAAVTVNIYESGGDVVAEASGTIDTSGLVGPGPGGEPSGILNDGSNFIAILGSVPRAVYDLSFSSEAPFGPPAFASADSSSGQSFGIDATPGGDGIYLPDGYVSGAPISAGSTWVGQTLAGLNLTPGSYSFAWATDSVTFVISSAAPGTAQSIPVSPLWMLAVLAILMGATARRYSGRNRH